MIAKPRETAALLVCAGAVLLLPPIALIFAKTEHFFGIPLPVFYIFGTWLLLVAGAVFISHILPETEGSD